jgi:hypothetical protein
MLACTIDFIAVVYDFHSSWQIVCRILILLRIHNEQLSFPNDFMQLIAFPCQMILTFIILLEYFKENDVLLMSNERMVMLLVGECWCCWREVCVWACFVGTVWGLLGTVSTQVYIRVIFRPWALVYNICKWRCVSQLRDKKVFVNGQVSLSQKSMVCQDVLNYGRVLSGEPQMDAHTRRNATMVVPRCSIHFSIPSNSNNSFWLVQLIWLPVVQETKRSSFLKKT